MEAKLSLKVKPKKITAFITSGKNTDRWVWKLVLPWLNYLFRAQAILLTLGVFLMLQFSHLFKKEAIDPNCLILLLKKLFINKCLWEYLVFSYTKAYEMSLNSILHHICNYIASHCMSQIYLGCLWLFYVINTFWLKIKSLSE